MKSVKTKKLVALFMAVAMVATMGVQAFAADIDTAGGTGSSDVLLTAENGTTFSVTVPIAFPISVDGANEVTTADNLKIVNNSAGPVQVTNVTVTGANEWGVTKFDADMTKMEVGAKMFGFKLNGDQTDTDGNLSFTQDNFPVINGANINDDEDELPLTYDAVVATQKAAIDGEKIADVVFTIEWYEG